MRTIISILTALTLCGCGFLSNEQYFEGVGRAQGTITVDGQPVEGALVFVMDEDEVLESVRSGADGSFDVLARAGRDRRLVAVWGTGFGLQHEFDLAGEAQRDLGALDLKNVGELTGVVDVPVADPTWAQVQVIGTPFVDHPDLDGRFSLLLPAGRWSLEISAPGAETTRTDDVEVRSSQQKDTGTSSAEDDPDYTCDSSLSLTDAFHQGGAGALDVLFVMDNSRSMVGEQVALAESFDVFSGLLEGGGVDFRIAVITPGMESVGCQPCPPDNPNFYSCINETGEGGRFQDRLGSNIGSEEDPEFIFSTDATCKVVEPDNLDCFFDAFFQRGIAMVGVHGCGYERGLAAVRSALSSPLLDTWNAGFLRTYARLAVVLVSDEEDCGEVGDVTENIQGVSGKVCYYAAKGEGPDGSTSDPQEGRLYQLTPVSEYATFLRSLKPSPSLVSFSAIVGMEDPDDPLATEIRYESAEPNADAVPACSTPGCVSGNGYCDAYPGTRYIELAHQMGGVMDTICQADFSNTLARIAGLSTGYRSSFRLRRKPQDENSIISVTVDGETVANWTYSPESQAIVFPEDQAPPAFASVRVTYEVDCP